MARVMSQYQFDKSIAAPQDVFLRFRSANITKIGIPRTVCFGQVGGADEDTTHRPAS
jgi:hypothetical protein